MFYAYVITQVGPACPTAVLDTVTAQVTDAVTALHGDTVRYRETMDNINDFMEKNNIKRSTRVVTRRYLRAKMAAGSQDWAPLLGILSPDLQETIAAEMHSGWQMVSASQLPQRPSVLSTTPGRSRFFFAMCHSHLRAKWRHASCRWTTRRGSASSRWGRKWTASMC